MSRDIKKIKIVTEGNFPYGRASANYLRNLVTGLADHYDIEVLLPHSYNYGKVKNNKTERFGSKDNYRWRYLSVINSPQNKILRTIYNSFGNLFLLCLLIIGGLKKQIDVVIKYNIKFTSNLLLILACKLTGIKLINILPEFYNKPLSVNIKLIKWYNFYIGIKYLSMFSDGIIVLSKYLKDHIQSNGFNKPIIIIPNIIDPNPFYNAGNKKKNDNTLTIGYTGTPTNKDGIDDLLNAFALILKNNNNIKLLIVGDVPAKSVIPKLREKAKKIGIHENVSFTGLVEFSKIPGLINSCDILILTRPDSIASRAGFPTKLGEYMATKKPVVLTKVGDMKDYFKNTDCVILVEPGNIDSIASGIQLLIEKSNLRQQVGENGYEWMINNLEYKMIANKLVNYLQLL